MQTSNNLHAGDISGIAGEEDKTEEEGGESGGYMPSFAGKEK
jgi:hypothetical protein